MATKLLHMSGKSSKIAPRKKREVFNYTKQSKCKYTSVSFFVFLRLRVTYQHLCELRFDG